MKYLKLAVSITILLFVLISAIISMNQENGLCDEYKPIYDKEFQGKIVKRYIKTTDRPYHHIVVRNYNDSVYDLNWIFPSDYDSCEVNDSIFKLAYSVKLELYKRGIHVKDIQLFSGPCPSYIEEFPDRPNH